MVFTPSLWGVPHRRCLRATARPSQNQGKTAEIDNGVLRCLEDGGLRMPWRFGEKLLTGGLALQESVLDGSKASELFYQAAWSRA